MNQVREAVAAALAQPMGEPVDLVWRTNIKGVQTGWCRLHDPGLLLPAAQAVAGLQGRLSMVTASLSERAKAKGVRELAYHFDLDGTTLTVTLQLPLVGAAVPSLTPVFRNADWNEREFMELYDIRVTGHPDPRRLFLGDSTPPAVFERLIPFTTFTSGAVGTALWDRVMAGAAGEEPA